MSKSSNTLLQFAPFATILVPALFIAGFLLDGFSRDLYFVGDYAILEMGVYDAAHLSQSLGMPSRFGWAHPGAFNYYLLALFYIAGGEGSQSLWLGTLFWNVIFLISSSAIVARLTNITVAGAFTIILAAYLVLSIGPNAPWNVMIPAANVLPWVLSVCLACLVAIEGYRWVPLLVLSLCFVTQAHVSTWLPAVILAAMALIAAPLNRRQTKRDLVFLLVGLAIALLIWLPPIIEWRNLTLIVSHFFSDKTPEHTIYDALRAFSGLIGQAMTLSYIDLYPNIEARLLFVGVCVLLAVIVLTVVAARQQNRFAIHLGVFLIGLAVVEIFSLSRFTGPIMTHSILYMTTLAPLAGLLLLAVVCPSESRIVAVASTVAGIALTFIVWSKVEAALVATTTPSEDVRRLSSDLISHLERSTERQTIFIEHEVWPFAVGAVSQAYRHGYDFALPKFWSIIVDHVRPISESGPGVVFTKEKEEVVIKDVP